MNKIRIYIVAASVAAFGVLPAAVTPASADHTCGLGDPLLDSICEGYHDIPQLILCKIAPKFCF
jgi:hypothetical protein